MKTLRKIFCVLFFLTFTLAVVATGYYFFTTKDISLQPEKLVFQEKTLSVYDAYGEIIPSATAGSQKESVPFSSIPKKTVYAFVDTEDKRFFAHRGFDFRRIIKAVYNNAVSHAYKQGASTISQQLIKNTHLSHEKKLSRKLKEWKLTKQLEKRYTKEEILERYLSVIYFGHNCFGIRAAAQFYFGKEPAELDLADSAILAGLVKSPNNYSPFKNPENCKKRKESVLRAMLKNGNITQEEKEIAVKKPLPTAPNAHASDSGYLHFVYDELTALSESNRFTVGGNIQIYTYFDPKTQEIVEKNTGAYIESDKSIMVLDKETGGFKACVSTVGNIRRSPGSTIKPLLVYAPALQENSISLATPLLDEKINYGGYSPSNYDGKYHGYISARECIEKSLNIPAVKLLESVGIEKCASYLEKMQLSVEKEDLSLALALGGMKNGYPLKSLLSAYATLANQGIYNGAGFISKIKINEKTVFERKNAQTRVFSEETVTLLTDALKTTAQSGTAKKLRSLPFDIAAKTGTVGTEKGNTDAYAISYTTKDIIGVWLGNANNSYIDYTGGSIPCNMLYSINEDLYRRYQTNGQTVESFPACASVTKVKLDKISYYDTHTLSLADPISPPEFQFTELFKTEAIPQKTATFFSNPTINPPILRYTDGKVQILFDNNAPTFYDYKIERYDYATHNTVYQGGYLEIFTDDGVEKGKRYAYFVTPLYGTREGKKIALPIVSTKEGESLTNNEEILEKNWWNY